jgi:hypothetical protein
MVDPVAAARVHLRRDPRGGVARRLLADRFVSARRAGAGRFTGELLDTVDWCLRLNHLERPQSVFALQKALLGEKPPEYRGETPMLEQLKGALLRLARR